MFKVTQSMQNDGGVFPVTRPLTPTSVGVTLPQFGFENGRKFSVKTTTEILSGPNAGQTFETVSWYVVGPGGTTPPSPPLP